MRIFIYATRDSESIYLIYAKNEEEADALATSETGEDIDDLDCVEYADPASVKEAVVYMIKA